MTTRNGSAGKPKSTLVKWCHNKFGSFYRTPLGDVLRLLFVVSIGAFPVAHEFGYLTNRWWLVAWSVAFVSHELFVWWLNGLGSLNLTKRIARINRDIAGNIDSLARTVVHDGDKKIQRINEGKSHSICMSLLARVLDITLNEYPKVEPTDIRVTLAIPQTLQGFSRPTSLRVWCYDRPHSDSHWTEFPLPSGQEAALAGAADAFVSNETRIIQDLRTVPDVDGVENSKRRYRSVVSVPVPSGGTSGRPCAVLNIDAAGEGFFSEDVVWERILPLSAPILSAISFVLRLRNPGATFQFGN